MTVAWVSVVLGVAVAALALFGAIAVGFVRLLRLNGGRGSWRRLAREYASDRPMPAATLHRQTIRVGAVAYRRSAEIGADADGLHLALSGASRLFGLPPLLLPWSQIAKPEPARLYGRPAMRLAVPSAATDLHLYLQTYQALADARKAAP